MRFFFLPLALALGTAPAATATDAGPNARTAYVERRGLIEADAQCGLFTAEIRAALQVGLAQARGSLLREGWTSARVRELDSAARAAARARACDDQRTASSANSARRAFTGWVNASTMEFPGWQRSWRARRAGDAFGWRLSQEIEAPIPAMFGIREHDDVQRLTLAFPLSPGQQPPASATLIMRDEVRVVAREIALPERVAQGLRAGLPAPGDASNTPSTRTTERIGGRSYAVYTFPDSAFRTLLSLDPRESVEIRLANGRTQQSLLVEVGDAGAARGFLAIR